MISRVIVPFVIAASAGCWGGPPPAQPLDFAHPDVDPVACSVAALERLGARIPQAQLSITQQPIVEAQRIDKQPCSPGMTDDACLAIARRRGVPAGYDLLGITIAGDGGLVEMTYEVDGRRATEQAESFEVIVDKLKALQAQGRRVTVIEGHTVEGAETRHAKLVYAREGGRQRRVANLRWRLEGERAEAIAQAQRIAETERMYLQQLAVDGEDLVMTATCADPGAPPVRVPPGEDVSPGI